MTGRRVFNINNTMVDKLDSASILYRFLDTRAPMGVRGDWLQVKRRSSLLFCNLLYDKKQYLVTLELEDVLSREVTVIAQFYTLDLVHARELILECIHPNNHKNIYWLWFIE